MFICIYKPLQVITFHKHRVTSYTVEIKETCTSFVISQGVV